MDVNAYSNHQQVAAPVDTDTAGTGATTALSSAVRIVCPDTSSTGTGFVHKSGRVITAEHVVRASDPTKIVVLSATGQQARVSKAVVDARSDLALLTLTTDLHVPPIPLSTRVMLKIGTQVSTWGYPGGYMGVAPLLTVGYLSGIDQFRDASGSTNTRWVVNAAFNSGNSGGPLLHIEDGSVIGVVSSKLAPLPEHVLAALDALTNQQSGFMYQATAPDGSSIMVSEGQVIAQVLHHLRSQTQLVIGYAVVLEDIRNFLSGHGVVPD